VPVTPEMLQHTLQENEYYLYVCRATMGMYTEIKLGMCMKTLQVDKQVTQIPPLYFLS
jgi:hypothetical protein